MANSVLLLNSTQPKGDYITFFSELNSDFVIGDKVFIVGGNYDNTVYTDKTNVLYDPFHEFAIGYTVVSIDNTDVSNGITLNIPYRKAIYNTLGVDTTQYTPLSVYNINQDIKEAYITKTYVKRGEINGGIFEDGIFGEKDKETAIFNNRFDSDVPAQFTNGVILGGNYQWGDFKTKYVDTKVGKKQTLNEFNGITNVYDSSKYNIEKFSNNNNGYGYSIVVSGNLGKVYNNSHDITTNGTNFSLTFNDYVPYPLWKAYVSSNPFKFDLQLKIVSPKNNRTFDIKSITNKTVVFNTNQMYNTHIEDSILFDEQGIFEIIILVKNNTTGIINSLNSGRFFKPNIYAGVFNNVNIQGGNIYWGEFKNGIYASNYDKLFFNDGVVNGVKNSTYLNDVRWNNGIFIDGNWRGSDIITIKNFTITPSFTITVSKNYKQLLNIGDSLMVSYIKKGIGSSYLQNYTDKPGDFPLNFSEFVLDNITETVDNINNNQITLLLSGDVNVITDETNLVYAKISQSYFNKGVWYNGIWESGLRKIKNTRVESYNLLDQNHLEVIVENNDINYGDFLEISNLNVERNFTISILDNATSGLIVDNRIIDYIEPFVQTLRVVDINNNTLKLEFKTLDKKFNDINIIETSYITKLSKIISSKNEYTVLTPAIWVDGQFNSGVWDGGIMRGGILSSTLYFDKQNIENQIVWKSGYHRTGDADKMIYLSGIWENGNYISGVISNLINNQEINDKNLLSNGDSVFVDGIFGDSSNNLEFRRGLMLEGIFLGGKIINGGIENITFRGGEYTNGLGVYSNQYYTNRSGKINQTGIYDNLSAPSVIYVDGDGWVQLDQPSFFQKDYNVIFEDFDRYQNPLNGQMFDIINRDTYGTKVQIEYSTSGNNPIYIIDEFKNLNPIICIDNLKDFAQYSDNEYYFLDSTNNRIIYLDKLNKKVDVLGRIVGKQDIWNFANLQFIDIPTKYNSFDILDNIYIVDNNILKRINKSTNTIFSYVMNLNVGEEIIDMKSLISGNAPETVVMLTSNNRLLFTTSDSKITYIESNLVNTKSISVLRKQNTSSIDLFIINGLTVSHLIFDYNGGSYSYRQTSPIVINNMFVGNIISVSSYYETIDIILYLNVDNDLYRFIYSEIYTSVLNSYVLLNTEKIDNKISSLKLSQEFKSINSLNYDSSSPLIVNNSSLINTISGFGETFSNVKLMDVEGNSTSGTILKYWYYDNTTNRIIYIDENLSNYSETDIITLPKDNIVHKLIKGDSKNKVFAIESDNTGNYFIRRCEYGKKDGENSTIIKINNITSICDLVYNNGLYVLVINQQGYFSICKLNNLSLLTFNYGDVVILDNLNNNSIALVGSTSNASFDMIFDNNRYYCLISTSLGIYQIYIYPTYFLNGGLIENYSNFLPLVNDICLTKNSGTNGTYSLFLATTDGVYNIHSDAYVNNLGSFHYRWSYLNSMTNKYSDIITNNISLLNNKLVFDGASLFVIQSPEYLTNIDNIKYFAVDNDNNVFSVSNQRIINSTSGIVIDGIYNQIGRNGVYYPLTGLYQTSISDILLNNPSHIVSGLTGTSETVIYYKDTTIAIASTLRGYNITNNTKYCVDFNVVAGEIKDMVFYNNHLYALVDTGASRIIKYYNSNLTTSAQFGSFPINMAYLSMNNYLGNDYIITYNYSGNIVITPITLPATITSSVTLKNISNIKDISFVVNANVAIIYLLFNNGDLGYLEYSGNSTIITPSEWVFQMTEYNDIVAISENQQKNKLDFYTNNSTTVQEIDISNIRNINVNIVSTYSFDTTSNIFLVYNDDSLYKGVALLNNINTINLTQIVLTPSIGNFVKMLPITNNIVYVLYDNGDICLFDMVAKTSINIGSPTPELRDNNINDLISNYSLKAIDITIYNNKLVVIYNYLTTSYYDMFIYDNIFTKNGIEWLYPSDLTGVGATYGIYNTGLPNNNIFNGSTGGNRYLFYSTNKPSLSSLYGVIYLYFENDFIKLSKIDTYDIINNSVYNDLIIKVKIPFYNSTKDIILSSGINLVDTNDNSVICLSNFLQIGSTYTIGSEIIVLGSDEAIIKFPFQSDITKNFTVNIFTTILPASIYNPYSSVQDFIVFDDNSGNEIVVRELLSDNIIFSNINEQDFFVLNSSITGIWSVDDSSSVSKYMIYSPLTITNTNNIVLKVSDNTWSYKNYDYAKLLTSYNNSYVFENIVKGYKVSDTQVLSPYLTSRVLYDTIIEKNVNFNKFGTTFTAHLVNSRWNNGLFVGTWSKPDYFNNNKIDGFSVFINGDFNGDFYNGFFLGGNINNNSNFISGHISSDSYPVLFNANVESPYRYDVLDITYINNKLKFNVETLQYINDDYVNIVNDKINNNVWVKIPSLFKNIEFEISQITKNDIKNYNHDEITLVVKKPLTLNGMDLSGTNGDVFITDFILNQKLFINAFEKIGNVDTSEFLFGEYVPQNVFVYNNNIYITIKSEFVDFDSQGVYTPFVKPIITFNEYFKVVKQESYIKNSKYYSNIFFDIYVPENVNPYNFIQSFYLKDNTQIIMSGDYIGSIYFEDYIQMFNTSFNKTDKPLFATINNTLKNIYISDVLSLDNTSIVSINTTNIVATNDIMVWNSNIVSNTNNYILNSVFLSGHTNINFKTGAWLNKDIVGFSKGVSSFNNLNATFEGVPTKINNIYFEGNDYVWIKLENIIFNVDKKRYITLRGFIGDKANVIGSTTSKVYRIEEVEDNFIKIKNPFKLFQDFNKDKLGLAKQSMLLKDLSGDNVDCSNLASIDLKNPEFVNNIGNVVVDNNWYFENMNNSVLMPTNNFTYLNNQVKITGMKYEGDGKYVQLSQKYLFLRNHKYRLVLNIFSNGSGNMTANIFINNSVVKTLNVVSNNGYKQYSYEYTSLVDSDKLSINCEVNGGIYILESVHISSLTESVITKDFYYGYASQTCFNGGDFTGTFNSIWNAGNFLNGEFNGEWFGTEESYAWNGQVNITTIQNNGTYKIELDLKYASVEDGDFVLIEYPKIFDGINMVSTYPNQYCLIYNKKATYNSEFIIPNNSYLVNITIYRKNYLTNNTLLTNFNSNVKINDNITTHDIIDYVFDSVLGTSGVNKVISFNNDYYINTIDYLNIANNQNNFIDNGFMIDMCFKKIGSQSYQPLLGFHSSSNNLNGFKLYVKNNMLTLEFFDKTNPKSLVIIGNVSTSWNHIQIIVKDGIGSTKLNGIIGNSFTITLIPYDICFIGKILNESSDNKITDSTFNGEMDEIRIWSKINDLVLFNGNNTSVKIVNQYIPDLVAYYNFDRLGILDDAKYYPEEEQFFVLNDKLQKANTLRLLDDNGDTYYYGEQSLFCEFDVFVEKPSDIAKILTFEESRVVDANGVEIKYYLELLVQPIVDSDTEFNLVVREKMTYDNSIVYPSNNFQYVDYTISDTLLTGFNLKYYNWNNIIIDDSIVFINGQELGSYKLVNRNVFKYTLNTSIIFGYYEYAYWDFSLGMKIEPTIGITGFIKGFNLWKNDSSKDNYYIYRIISGEDVSNYNGTNFINANNNLKTGNNIILPTFNVDGSNNWENYIYSDNNNFSAPINTIDINGKPLPMNFAQLGLEQEKLNTILPNNDWLNGTDFTVLDTSNTQIPSSIPSIVDNNYLLTWNNNQGSDFKIPLTNTDNFKFFNKDVNDNGSVQLSITASGFMFFEKVLTNGVNIQNYPLFDYKDNNTDSKYYQTSTTESIMLNNIIDIRSLNGGYVEYVDRQDEFVIKFYGKSTNIDLDNYGHHYYDNTLNDSQTNYSFFAIRIDKKNSNILFYVRRLGESNNQKLLGLRRSDGFENIINDTTRINYNKNSGASDFVIGDNNSLLSSSNNTEYILFVPRFSSQKTDKSYTSYIANKDYDFISENYGLSVYKSFNASNTTQYNLVVDNTLTPSYYYFNNGLIPYVSSNYKNIKYPFNEQYYGYSDYLFNNSHIETEDLVSRVSYFYGGNFNSTLWRNGVFVGGNINVNNFIWKYGIKYNGVISGDGLLKDSSHWLGGYHNGNNDISSVSDLIWYRGRFSGGQWLKGQWLAMDLDLNYCLNNCTVFNDSWSIFDGGEWYSRFNQNKNQTPVNIFKDFDNGTFENGNKPLNTTEFNFSTGNYNIGDGGGVLGSTYLFGQSLISHNNTSTLNFDGVKMFGSSTIFVSKNTEYTASVYVNIPTSINGSNGGIKIIAKGFNNDIINKVNIATSRFGNIYYQDIQEGSGTPYRILEINSGRAQILHTFNTGNNEKITIEIQGYNFDVNFNVFMDTIDIQGIDLSINNINPDKISNHDSVWHGGVWESKLVNSNLRYTYLSDTTKQYIINNSNILELPKVNSIWLGGLWLRGEFRGGIFANGFWHSTLCEQGTSGLLYENSIGYQYDKTRSTFYEGKMLNSVWNGGSVVEFTGDRLDVVFGDLNNLYSIQNPQLDGDFTWNNDLYFKFKKSDFVSSYTSDIFGRPLFNGFHNGLSFDGSDITNNAIEINRVRNQFNSDGVYGVYWKRGDFGNGILQFSYFDSLDLNNERQNIITEVESKNNSIFRKGYVYSSTWKAGLFVAISNIDIYPFTDDLEPNSLFYYSSWEMGYWKAKGLNSNHFGPYSSSLDTTDNIDITNALFSRSLWSSGVFEGGSFDLSIWRSGFTGINGSIGLTRIIEYKGEQTQLIRSEDNLAFNIDYTFNNTDYTFGTNGSSGIPFFKNDNNFISTFENSNYRKNGSVDNMASIFVNGHMRGSVWHGGLWMRGMFEHKDNISKNFFGSDISINDTYSLGIWTRGIWFSGYFSSYNDKNTNIYTNDNYMYNNGVVSEKGKRSLFFGIDSSSLSDANNIMGMSDNDYEAYVLDTSNGINSKHNFASIFSRRLLKDSVDSNNPNIIKNTKPYFNIFNGSFMNGIFYQENNDYERMIMSVFSNFGDFIRISSGVKQIGIDNNIKYFNTEFKTGNNISDTFSINYSNVGILKGSSSNIVSISDGNIINNNSPINLNIWRHNIDESPNNTSHFGDGVIVNGTNGLMFMDDSFNRRNRIQVSIAQGDGMVWINDEANGEPRYHDGIGDSELNSIIYDFQNPIYDPNQGFDNTDFFTNP